MMSQPTYTSQEPVARIVHRSRSQRRPLWGIVSALALVLGTAGVLSACQPQKATQATLAATDPAFNTLLDAIAKDALQDAPEAATSLGVTEEQAGGPYKARLGDRSQAQYEKDRARLMSWRAKLAEFDRTKLDPAQQVTLDMLNYQLAAVADGAAFGHGNLSPLGWFAPYVMTQLNGAYLELPDFLDSQHPIVSLADGQDYVTRLGQVAAIMDAELERAKSDADLGFAPPRFTFERITTIVDQFLSQAPAQNVFSASLARRLGAIKGLDPKAVAAQNKEAQRIVETQIYPAYRRLRDWTSSMIPKASTDAGVWRVKDGEAFYKAALKLFTTTDMTPDQVHETGLKLIETLTAEADQILKAQGLTEGSVAARLQILSKDPKYLYANDDTGRQKLLDDLNAQVKALQARLPEQFGTLPKTSVEIRRIPAFTEAGAPGGYYQSGSLDGSRPGAYYINLRDTTEWPSWTLPTLSYHEAIPGHHLQGTIALERQDLPLLRRMMWNSAYGEGWALYSEQLADEMGVYDGNPVARLGYLQSMLFRAARLVVDTGLHAKKWSREQAIAYMVSVTGDSESSVATEVERYSVWPGQACAYMTGRVQINALRDNAKSELKQNYDQRAFHDLVLSEGALPLGVLSTRVDRWIASRETKK